MDLIQKVVVALGAVGTIRGLFGIWNGWETYSIGKKNDNPQQQEQGISGMTYGAMMAAGSVAIAAAIGAALGAIRF